VRAAYADGPALAMVDSGRGITNLHVPSDVIVDASMPAAIRSSGQMWDANGGRRAGAAEEYGSHDKTFEMTDAGTVRVIDESGATLMEHAVKPGDIWR